MSNIGSVTSQQSSQQGAIHPDALEHIKLCESILNEYLVWANGGSEPPGVQDRLVRASELRESAIQHHFRGLPDAAKQYNDFALALERAATNFYWLGKRDSVAFVAASDQFAEAVGKIRVILNCYPWRPLPKSRSDQQEQTGEAVDAGRPNAAPNHYAKAVGYFASCQKDGVTPTVKGLAAALGLNRTQLYENKKYATIRDLADRYTDGKLFTKKGDASGIRRGSKVDGCLEAYSDEEDN
jgi:hypothetical protein